MAVVRDRCWPGHALPVRFCLQGEGWGYIKRVRVNHVGFRVMLGEDKKKFQNQVWGNRQAGGEVDEVQGQVAGEGGSAQ